MRANAIRQNIIAFERDTRPLREGIKNIRADRDLTTEAKEARIADNRRKLDDAFERYERTQRSLITAIEREHATSDPQAVMRRAARKDPARANALADMAARASDAEIRAHVREAALEAESDLVFAYAVGTLAADRLNRISGEERTELHRTLRRIGTTPEAARAQSELVVGRAELARFESMRDPLDNLGALTRYREATTLDLGEGARSLSEAEVRAHYTALRMDPDFAVVIPAEDSEPKAPRAEPFHKEVDDLLPAA